MKIKHTRRTLTITVLLLILAASLQIGFCGILIANGMDHGSPLLIILTLFPGGLGWFLPFHYAFSLPKGRRMGRTSGLPDDGC